MRVLISVVVGVALIMPLGAATASAAMMGETFTVSRVGTSATYEATSPSTTYSGSLKSVVESAVSDLDAAGGGTIEFTSGDFDLGADWFEFDEIAYITFQGAGIGATVLRNSSDAMTDTEPFDVVGGTDLVLRDFTVQAGGAPRTTSDGLDFDNGSGIVIERVAVTESRGRGIIFDGKGPGWDAVGNTVRDCVISGLPGDGIELLASTDNLIEGCSITDVGGHGIQATKSSSGATQSNKKSSDNVLRNNTIDNSGQDGINVNSSDRNQITGNTVLNSSDDKSGRDGIRIGATDSITCDDNVVDGNLATDTQATKTQSYGLNIASSLCNRTVVGGTNNFDGNRVGPIRDVGTDTIYEPPPPDDEAPTAPSDLQATSAGSDAISLSWTAATDNVGVAAYQIHRDGTLVAEVGGATLTYDDAALDPSTTYSYVVHARDAAGNVSPPSNTAEATTDSAPASGAFTFTPAADSYVHSSHPSKNYGTSTSLRLDGSPTVVSYLRFDVGGLGGEIDNVTLRIFPTSSNKAGCGVHSVSDTTWDELTITWSNAPDVGAAAASCPPLSGGSWAEIDLTSSGLVTGNGAISIAIVGVNSTATALSSREGSAPPELVVETIEPPPPDDTPPSQPTGLKAVAVSGCEVDLTWNASTDDVGVTGYGIYRDGELIASVDGSTLTFTDAGVSPGSSYSYTVDAVDVAGSRSTTSDSALVTTPSQACSQTLLPTDDSWVDEGEPSANNGTKTQLRVDGSPVLVSYLKFDVPTDGTVTQATLRIFVNSNHSVGYSVHLVADTTWSEATITFDNAPAYGDPVASSGPFSGGSWVEVDVTPLIQGGGLHSIALTTTSVTAMSLASRESGDTAPQLIVETN